MIRAARAAALLLALALASSAGVRAGDAPAPVRTAAVTQHVLHLANGATLAYTATAGFLTLHDAHNAPAANVFSTAYTTGDRRRPVTFLYNGGPGSASLWLELGAFGPRRIAMTDGAPLPAPGGQLTDNPATLLTISDLVFIDPVGTGYSTTTGKAVNADFWGVDEDIRAFEQFVKSWLTANNRTSSAVFLLGESYGTFRSAGLADRLQRDGTPVSGVILLSSLLDYADDFGNPGVENVPDAFAIPSEAAVAWYHKAVANPPADVQTFAEAARRFTSDEFLPALMRAPAPDAATIARLTQRLHDFIGIDPDVLARAHLRLSAAQFQMELLRAQNEVTGRYDGRITAPRAAGRRSEPDPSFDAIEPAFTSAFVAYAKNELHWNTADRYRTLPGEIVNAWNFRRSGFAGRVLAPTTIPDLRDALQRNPNMHVFAAGGYFDLATPFLIGQYELANVGLDPALAARITQHVYASGHMIYLTDDALRALRADLGRFYTEAAAVR